MTASTRQRLHHETSTRPRGVQATDLAPEFAQGARVLNKLTGHTDSATRERICQDPQNGRGRARPAEARRSTRADRSEAKRDTKEAA